MVIIMTFSIELFIMLLAGIGIGHYYVIVGDNITIIRTVPPNNDSIRNFTSSTEPTTWSTTADTTISIPCCEFLSSYHPNENNHCAVPDQDSYEHDKFEDLSSSSPGFVLGVT
jgi:hypothetical protein